MSSTADLTQPTAINRTATAFWIALTVFGLAMIGCAVAGSYYTNIIGAPYVEP